MNKKIVAIAALIYPVVAPIIIANFFLLELLKALNS